MTELMNKFCSIPGRGRRHKPGSSWRTPSLRWVGPASGLRSIACGRTQFLVAGPSV